MSKSKSVLATLTFRLVLTSRCRRREQGLVCNPSSLPASDLDRSKDVTCLTGASKAVLHGRSQEATVGGWLRSARQSGPSDGLRVSVI
jgi:hypothetical protein